jgi:hypothetical protein
VLSQRFGEMVYYSFEMVPDPVYFPGESREQKRMKSWERRETDLVRKDGLLMIAFSHNFQTLEVLRFQRQLKHKSTHLVHKQRLSATRSFLNW